MSNSTFEAEYAAAMAAETAAAAAPQPAEIPPQQFMEGDAGSNGEAPMEQPPETQLEQPAPAQPAPQRSALDERFSELTTRARAAEEMAAQNLKLAQEAIQRSQMVDQQLAELRNRLPAGPKYDPVAAVVAQFSTPEEQALASVVGRVVNGMLAPIQDQLAVTTANAEQAQTQQFWSQPNRARLAPEVKQRAESFYQQYRHTGIDRTLALRQVLGEMAEAGYVPPPAAAAPVAPGVAAAQQQNRTAVASLAPPAAGGRIPAPQFDAKKASADELWNYLQKHGNTASD